MLRAAGLVLSLLLAIPMAAAQPRRAPAPEPPCTATGTLREAICATPALRAAHREVQALERRLARLTPLPATVAVRAATWARMIEAEETLSASRPFTPAELLDAHAERVAALQEGVRQATAMRRLERPQPVFPRPPLERGCLGGVLRDCRVTGAGMVASEGRATRILWQRQLGFTEQDGVRAGIVLLAEAPGGWRLLGWDFAGVRYEAPELAAHEGGTLLVVPGRLVGSGGGSADLLFQRRGATWHEIEMESWHHQVAARLPPGLDIRSRVAFDVEDLTARTSLWREADANCCPSAGRAILEFRIQGDALVLAGVELDAAARAARPPVASCPAERASYRLGSEHDFTAELRYVGPGTGAESDLVLKLHSGRTQRDYWFRFTAAQGFGGMSLLPVEAPGPTIAEDGVRTLDVEDDVLPLLGVHPVGDDLAVWSDPPRRGGPAPRHFFMPRIGSALHYGQLPQQASGAAASGGAGGGERITTGFWTLHACRQAA